MPLPEAEAVARAKFWLQGILWFQFACQVALLFEAIGSVRIVVRCAAFGISLAMLAFLPGRGPAHPARRWALVALGILGLELLHPDGNTNLARFAQVGLYLAILAPLFWVSRLRVTPTLFHRVIVLFWLFNAVSATVGVLQVYYPGKFQPNLSTTVRAQGQQYVSDLQITLADGSQMFRPMGLTDVPGGAASAGMYAATFGLGFLLMKRSWWLRGAGVAGMGLGLFCIYLCQVRSALVVAGICFIVLAGILARRGEMTRLMTVGLVATAVVVAAFSWAVAVGGDTVTDRLATLTEDRAAKVYYANRGQFLEETFTVFIWDYPVGAGLGRWGMANAYFGDNTAGQKLLWSEIQWTGWLFDGGIPLMIAYGGAVLLACWFSSRVALRARRGTLEVEAALLTAYNVGAFAITFSYPLFIGQSGLEFWILNACLFGATVPLRRPNGPPPGSRTDRQESLGTPRRLLGAVKQ